MNAPENNQDLNVELAQVRLGSLVETVQAQRNDAQNQVANLTAELAVTRTLQAKLQEKITEQSGALLSLSSHHQEVEAESMQLKIALSNVKNYLLNCGCSEEEITSIITGTVSQKCEVADVEVETEDKPKVSNLVEPEVSDFANPSDSGANTAG